MVAYGACASGGGIPGLANAFAFAWALAVTFPLYAGP